MSLSILIVECLFIIDCSVCYVDCPYVDLLSVFMLNIGHLYILIFVYIDYSVSLYS